MKRPNVYVRAGALLLALMLALLLAACGDDNGDTDAGAQPDETVAESEAPDDEEEAEGGAQVSVTATEFEFDLPETLPAGETTFSFVNAGKQPHELLMFKLAEDAPALDKLIQLPQKKAEAFFEGPPSSAFAKPGESQEGAFTTELVPGGRYAYVCFVEDKKTKKPHAFLGMVGEFTAE